LNEAARVGFAPPALALSRIDYPQMTRMAAEKEE
jgi:hypothetical protein